MWNFELKLVQVGSVGIKLNTDSKMGESYGLLHAVAASAVLSQRSSTPRLPRFARFALAVMSISSMLFHTSGTPAAQVSPNQSKKPRIFDLWR